MIESDLSVEIRLVVSAFTFIKKHRRLEVREARFYRKAGSVPHDFFVFGIHDLVANDPSTPLTYIRVDCFGKDKAQTSNTMGNRMSRAEDCNHFAGSFSSSTTPTDERIYPSAVKVCMRGSQTSVFFKRKADIQEYEFAVKFSQHTDPMALIILASSIKNIAPEDNVPHDNYYYFSKIIAKLVVEVLGAQTVSVPSTKKNAGKSTLFTQKLLSEEDFKILYEGASLRYGEKWREFEQRVSLSSIAMGMVTLISHLFKRLVRPCADEDNKIVLIHT